RTLVRDPVRDQGHYGYPAVSPSGRARGRLLAVGLRDGVGLWDLASGAEVGFLPADLTECVAFDASGALWTNGDSGVRRWPVADDPASEGVRIGPPERLLARSSRNQIACSRDGRVVAVAWGNGGVVLHRDRPGQGVPLRPHDDVRYISVSP